MEIDLFTLIAQIINLLILLFLLRKFLYLPVLKAVNERQKAIADELQAAEDAQQTAIRTVQKCEKQMQKLEAQKQEILQQAHDEADKLAADLTAKAHKEYTHQQEQWKQHLQGEQKNFEHTMQKAIAAQFNRFAQKALRQIADTDINELAVAALLRKLRELPEPKQQEYAAAFADKPKIEVKSAQPLSPQLKAQLKENLQKMWQLSAQTKFEFSADPELIGGLCMQADEQLVSWNLQEYLQEFDRNLNKETTQFLSRGKDD